MIRTFADRDAEAVFSRRIARRLPTNIQRTARRKLIQLDRAQEVRDLRAPPGFVWRDGDAYEVEIVDYHS